MPSPPLQGTKPRRRILAVGLTVVILVSLIVVAQPTSAVKTTISGADEVGQTDTESFNASVEIREDERVPIDNFSLVISTEDGETVEVTFAPNGTILDVEPERGVVGDGEIRINLLRRTLNITPVSQNADFDFGFRSGTDERNEREYDFGYGYGYGYGAGEQPTFEFLIELDGRALKQGTYGLQLGVNTDQGTLFESNVKTFEVVQRGQQEDRDRGRDGDRDRDRGSDRDSSADQDRDRGQERDRDRDEADVDRKQDTDQQKALDEQEKEAPQKDEREDSDESDARNPLEVENRAIWR